MAKRCRTFTKQSQPSLCCSRCSGPSSAALFLGTALSHDAAMPANPGLQGMLHRVQHHRGSCAKYCGVTYCARMVSPANMRPWMAALAAAQLPGSANCANACASETTFKVMPNLLVRATPPEQGKAASARPPICTLCRAYSLRNALQHMWYDRAMNVS